MEFLTNHLQPMPIANRDPGAGNRDRIGLLEPGQGPADGLDRQPKVIRDVGSCHRKVDHVGCLSAINHFHQKPGNALGGTLAAQRYDTGLGSAKVFGRLSPQPPSDILALFSERLDPPPGIASQRGVTHRLRRIFVLSKKVEADVIARE